MIATECTEWFYNPFKFTGQWFDAEIGQYYLRARMYDPQLMRLTSRDPITGKFEESLTLHKYLYCTNDSINKVDPTGLWEKGKEAGGDWHGHSDFGSHEDGFDYVALDKYYPATIPLFTAFHFLSLDMAQGCVYMALLSGDKTLFGYARHMGQDSFSHYGKGYRAFLEPPDMWGHGRHIEHNASNPDYPYNASGKLSSEYIEANKWTKRMEEVWHLFEDPYKWIGASD